MKAVNLKWQIMSVVVLPDAFRGLEARRNSMETKQSGHASWFGPEIKDGRSRPKNGVPKRLRGESIQ